jgi:DNA-directed RNA polymerase specialized sigma24 family protein
MTREEFDRWIGRYRPRLMRVARKVCGSFDAADAVQDAIASIYTNQSYNRVCHAGNLVAYFGRVVTRCAYNTRQSRVARVRRESDYTHGVSGFLDERGQRTSPARRAD